MDLKSTSSSLGFRLSGGFIKNENGIPCEVMKKGDFLTSLKQKHVNGYIQKLFSSNEKKFNMKSLNDFIIFLKDLFKFFKEQNTRSFLCTSILAIVDNISESYAFKLIGFKFVQNLPNDKQDENVITGLLKLSNIC